MSLVTGKYEGNCRKSNCVSFEFILVEGLVNLLPQRTGVIIGSGIGGIITLSQQQQVLSERGPRRVTPFLIPMMLADMASAQVSMVTGSMGANYCVVSSCSSGADALGQGWDMIRRGQSDVVLAGGSEAPISPIAVAGFNSMRALSRFNEDPRGASSRQGVNRYPAPPDSWRSRRRA